LGAVCWSGISKIVCGSRDEDARKIGFDEGPKPQNWVSSLESRGIDVVQDVLRDQATDVLTDYYKNGGLIYNSHRHHISKDNKHDSNSEEVT
jgi:tRNA(Arg) A34 adenosine deaminase TadA